MGMMDECEELILECWIPIKFVGTGWKCNQDTVHTYFIRSTVKFMKNN